MSTTREPNNYLIASQNESFKAKTQVVLETNNSNKNETLTYSVHGRLTVPLPNRVPCFRCFLVTLNINSSDSNPGEHDDSSATAAWKITMSISFRPAIIGV